MKKYLFIAVAMALGVCPLQARARTDMAASLEKEDVTIHARGGDRVFHVEIALTPEAQAYGLMNRTSLAPDAGMLFVFPQEEEHKFWMRDTLIPLDMVFIRRDGAVSGIKANAQPKDETAVPSGGPVLAVLELNGGAAAKLGIAPGDKVSDARYFK